MPNRLQEELPWWEYDRVGNVVTVGPADHQRFVCDRWESGDRLYHYHDAIKYVPDNAYAFTQTLMKRSARFTNSRRTCSGGHLTARVLAQGVQCSNAPDNLTTVDVTDSVNNHCE